jgi:hypothetical protein
MDMQRSTSRFDSVRNLLAGLSRRRPPPPRFEDSMSELRREMLAAVARAHADSIPSITRRIYCAEDIADLWFLRTDLMVGLASSVGEASAREAVASLSHRFDGLLPKSLYSRPSALAG